ncbi:MAG: hypothetical protein AAFO69_17380 [Bacteroidota bacterium]
MTLSLKELIISHINYRDIFNAPVKVSSLMQWIGAENNEQLSESVNMHLYNLENENLIVRAKGYVAVYGKEHIIEQQQEKLELTQRLIKKGESTLNFMNKLPFVRYVGVSGSLAADNPTSDKDGHIDLDLFVITAQNTLWIVFLIERVITNMIRLVQKNHFYCFNYVTEENFLEIYNKNFFTATEIKNMKTLSDDGVLDTFMSQNKWYEVYYPAVSDNPQKSVKSKLSLLSIIAWPVNYAFFALFCLGRGIKKGKLSYLKEFSSQFNPEHKCNLHRISNPNGGYQSAIQKRFERLLKSNFKNTNAQHILANLFPGSNPKTVQESAIELVDQKKYNSKYIISSDEQSIN